MELFIIFSIVGLAGLYLGWNFKKSWATKPAEVKKCSGDCRGCSCGH